MRRFQRFKVDAPDDMPERVSIRVYLREKERESERERQSQHRLAVVVWLVLVFAAVTLIFAICLLAWWLRSHHTR